MAVSSDCKTGQEQEGSFWGEVKYISSGANNGFKQFYKLTIRGTSSVSICFSTLMGSI